MIVLTVHHLANSQSDRVVWLLEELGLPYRLVWYQRTAEGAAPASYLALHPAATAPVIEDGDRVLSESEAILPYICHRHAGGRLTVPPEAPNYPDYLYWMALSNNLLGIFFAKRTATEATPLPLMQIIHRREQGYLSFLEQTLEGQDYLAGDEFTCADIMSLFLLRNPRSLEGGDGANRLAWVDRLSRRPAYIKANAIAGPGATPPVDAGAPSSVA
jgi:glutathione S-transferase